VCASHWLVHLHVHVRQFVTPSCVVVLCICVCIMGVLCISVCMFVRWPRRLVRLFCVFACTSYCFVHLHVHVRQVASPPCVVVLCISVRIIFFRARVRTCIKWLRRCVCLFRVSERASYSFVHLHVHVRQAASPPCVAVLGICVRISLFCAFACACARGGLAALWGRFCVSACASYCFASACARAFRGVAALSGCFVHLRMRILLFCAFENARASRGLAALCSCFVYLCAHQKCCVHLYGHARQAASPPCVVVSYIFARIVLFCVFVFTRASSDFAALCGCFVYVCVHHFVSRICMCIRVRWLRRLV
jgi:hypothetical protein